jgi:hypothetical protein
MRVPQVSERIKEVPAQALRGVFAGIGQLLLYTDKLRNKTPASQQVPQAPGPERPATAPDPAPAPEPAAGSATAPPADRAPAAEPAPGSATAPPAEKAPAARDLDKTGNVRLLNGAEATANGAVRTAGTAEPADAQAPATGESAAPLPNYDELSIASLRARLRNLDLAQVRQLAEYEKAHAARADVIGMFERRIAKLEAEKRADKRADEQGEADAEAEIEAEEEVGAEIQEEVAGEAEGEE